MTRWCGVHRAEVPDEEAQIVGADETGSGPSLPRYACITCIRDRGLLTPAAHTGSRNAGPEQPPRSRP